MILAKASIGTEDTGEYCEADGNAEKRENILDVGACKVVSHFCSLCNFDNDANSDYEDEDCHDCDDDSCEFECRPNAKLQLAATFGALTKQPVPVSSWQDFDYHSLFLHNTFKSRSYLLPRKQDWKSIQRLCKLLNMQNDSRLTWVI